jgi:DNA-binding MarR family transcriptional regulator
MELARHTDEALDDPSAARIAAVAAELRAVIGKLRRRLCGEGHLGDFTPSQVDALVWLECRGPATVTALARALGVRPQSMGETVAALKEAGVVSGAPDPADRRQTVLSLTQACRDRIEVARVAREDWLFRAIRTKLASAEQEELANGVALLKRLVDL